jgi:hypothetical protein
LQYINLFPAGLIEKTSLDWLSERNITFRYINISRLTLFGIDIVVAEVLAHSVERHRLTLLIMTKDSPDT